MYKHRYRVRLFPVRSCSARAARDFFITAPLPSTRCLQTVCKLFANRACLQTPRGPACKSNKQKNMKQTDQTNTYLFKLFTNSTSKQTPNTVPVELYFLCVELLGTCPWRHIAAVGRRPLFAHRVRLLAHIQEPCRSSSDSKAL